MSKWTLKVLSQDCHSVKEVQDMLRGVTFNMKAGLEHHQRVRDLAKEGNISASEAVALTWTFFLMSLDNDSVNKFREQKYNMDNPNG